MNNHRSLKAEIDAREENFSICLSLGRTLLNRNHHRLEEVRDKCIQVLFIPCETRFDALSKIASFVPQLRYPCHSLHFIE